MLIDMGAEDFGGSIGIPIGGNYSPEVAAIIENNIKDTCLSSILDKIINAKVSDQLSQQINSIFGVNDKINLFFNEGKVVSGPAQSIAEFNPDGTLNCTITVDISKFNANVSDEFIAATIIHEVSHMFIATTYSDKNSYITSDREKTILNNYITIMQSFLVDNFNLQPKQALSMIFCGMGWLADKPDPSNNHIGYKFWNQDTEDLYYQIIKDNGFSTIMNDANYYTEYNQKYSLGELGTKSCKF